MMKSIAIGLPINGDMLGISTKFWFRMFVRPDLLLPAASTDKRLPSPCAARRLLALGENLDGGEVFDTKFDGLFCWRASGRLR